MIILWIRRRKSNTNTGTEKKENQAFQIHDDIMKRFRLEHPDMEILNPKDILAGEENLLAPIQQVKLPENIQN
jgi:hypothetical protein